MTSCPFARSKPFPRTLLCHPHRENENAGWEPACACPHPASFQNPDRGRRQAGASAWPSRPSVSSSALGGESRQSSQQQDRSRRLGRSGDRRDRQRNEIRVALPNPGLAAAPVVEGPERVVEADADERRVAESRRRQAMICAMSISRSPVMMPLWVPNPITDTFDGAYSIDALALIPFTGTPLISSTSTKRLADDEGRREARSCRTRAPKNRGLR